MSYRQRSAFVKTKRSVHRIHMAGLSRFPRGKASTSSSVLGKASLRPSTKRRRLAAGT